jgi:hypothetical protein
MARRRRPEGVRFADMPAHLRRFVPEPWLDPHYYAAARVAWCRAHGLSVVDVRLAGAGRAAPSGGVRRPGAVVPRRW